ncbi:hypothetical protein KI387_017261, partial [Taxus chinensis]
IQLEEAKKTKEEVRIRFKKKEEDCKKPESEIVTLRKELEKKNTQLKSSLKFEKSTE